MTTEELATAIIDLIHKGENLKAEETYYADDIVSVEQDGRIVTGKAGVMEKTKAAQDYFEAFHGGGVVRTYVGPDSFLLEFKMDVTPKGGARMDFHQFGFYKVKDGKISEEYFFANPLSA